VVMPSMRYSWYTCDPVDWEMLNGCTTSEMECPIRLVPTIMSRSNSNNSHCLAMSRLASVQPDSWENTSQLIQVWAFPSHQGMVVPLNNKFTYCYTMTFGTWAYMVRFTVTFIIIMDCTFRNSLHEYNQEHFQTNSAVHSVNTSIKHHLHRRIVNLSCFQKNAMLTSTF
jgi:hypothetical protein